MRILLVLAVVGRLLRFFSMAFMPPILLAVVDEQWDDAAHFGIALGATLAFGYIFALFFDLREVEKRSLYRAEALAVVAFTWLTIAFFGAIPYEMQGVGFIDALFESMSGFTTTGATILTDFAQYDRPFFLWRSMTQWFGGLGVIALFVVILPRLGIAGRQLFFAEASGVPGEPVSSQIRHTASRLWMLYVGLTLLLIGCLIATGMVPFDAVCNALTTISAGGFSPNPESIYGYHNPEAEWVLVVFMWVSGMSFPLIYVSLTRKPLAFFRDGEWRFYTFYTLVGACALTAILVLQNGEPLEPAIRAGFFQAASIISSTGFASEDYNLWGDAARIIIVFVALVSGCAGSAAGGPKSVRHLLAGRHVLREIKRVLHPRAIIAIRYKGQAVPDDVMRSIFMLLALYVGAYFALGVVLVILGHDIVTAFSASLAAIGNIGPGFGEAGPMGSFAGFSDPAKVFLTLGMWVGRLEIVTVLALFHLDVWRNLHLRAFNRKGLARERARRAARAAAARGPERAKR